jgi:hypothetical protein
MPRFAFYLKEVGAYSRASHRHPLNGCFLPEGGGVEGVPSTKRNF